MTISVTDHAVLRYLERVQGLDIVAIRAAIAARVARCSTAAEAIGARRLTVVAEEASYVMARGVVVTVLPSGIYGTGTPAQDRDQPRDAEP